MQVIIIPAGSSSALINYRNTVETPVPVETIRTFAPDQITRVLEDEDGTSIIPVWGFRAGEGNRNVVRWNRIEDGCVALFGGEGKVKSFGTVVMKAQLPELASTLWGHDSEGKTWEYIIFLKKVIPLEDVSYGMLNAAAGYAQNYFIRAFEVWGSARSANVVRALQGWADGNYESNTVVLNALKSDAVDQGVFDPPAEDEAKARILASIIRRQGQPRFRRALIEAYQGKCAISGCDAVDALEAAHIIPYSDRGTNRLSNGLLLRADLHTLLDLGLLAINPETMTVILSPVLGGSSYKEFEGKNVQLPADEAQQPSRALLEELRRKSGL